MRASLLAGAFVVLGGCTMVGDAPPNDTPRDYFGKNRAGTSRDYGVIKWSDPEDHVITVHGYVDDMASCKEVVKALNANACRETDGRDCLNPYSCIALN
ncbi:hypothetical protein [Pseudoxanthomonas mexicana]|uniref:hypothetical protein n=1 Tax=Pseudoxanthomonas mexicana TaxID=128785 RepID=UPI0024E21408|nr:hypothetical protein [Pseudoxanthomonas mexicana]